MRYYILVLGLLIGLFWGCKKDKDEPQNQKNPLTVPSDYGYDSVSYYNNASQALNYANALVNFENELKKGRDITYSLQKAKLDSMYLILKSITPNSIQLMHEQYLNEIVQASGKTHDPFAPNEGGIYGGYIFNKDGVDLHELLTKSIWGISFLNEMNKLTANLSNKSQIDAMIAYYGAHPYFKNSYNSTLHGTYADKFSANYAARRDKNDGSGFYTKIKYNFLKLKAAVEAGENYNTEKQEAIHDIYKYIEKVYAATVINYCYSAKSKLELSNPTSNDFGSALHALGEAIVFITNIQNMTQKTLSDSDAQYILEQFNFKPTPNLNLFVTQTFNQLPKLNNVLNKLKSVYGFTDAEMEDFKNNWVQVQNR
jgi:hypothetical protein